jgi:hypothetical protein
MEEDDLTQAEPDELTASFSDWSSILTTSEQQLEWAHSQDVQILRLDRNPTLNDYVGAVHYKYLNPPQICDYPLAQAKDLISLP